MKSDTRRRLISLARPIISIGLLAWVIRYAGLAPLVDAARRADWRLYALAALLGFAGIAVRAVRWQALLDGVGAHVPFRRSLYLYFVGAFFNSFLPTGFGGDIMRVLEIGSGATSEQAAGTALVDRLTGFIMLFVLALAALPFGARLLPPGLALLIGLLAGGVLLGSALLLQGHWLRRATRRLPGALSLAGNAWIAKTYAVVTACGRRGLSLALFWSLIFNVLMVFASALVARALGLSVSIWAFFLFIPITSVALLLPISISGLGVREGLYVTLFGPLGVDAASAVALSLATYALDVITGLAGGGLYLGASLLGLRNAGRRPGEQPRPNERGVE